jgi:glycosyltransferase involved in cell wall biosynthesis
MTASTQSQRIWLTVSHPGMDEADTIGDMVRLKLVRAALESLGHTVKIITTRDGEASPAAGGQTNARAGRVKSLLKRFLSRSLWATLKDVSYRRNRDHFLAQLERRAGVPDLLIDYSFYWSDAAIAYGTSRGIPVILNVETLVADSMPEVTRSWLRRRGEAFEIAKYRQAARIWAVSSPLAEALVACAAVQPDVIDVIPNAAPKVSAPPGNIAGIPEDALVLGFVGGFADWYALDRLTEAFLELRHELPRLVLLLVGDGPERPRIEAMLRRAPHDAYLLPGKVPHADVARYISRMDVCAITNHTWWSSPLKLLEYGAAGKAVVAPDLPSIATMVSPNEVRLFRAGDFGEFTTACRSLLADDAARRRLGGNLRRAVETRYSPAAMAKRIEGSLSRLRIPG